MTENLSKIKIKENFQLSRYNLNKDNVIHKK